MSLVARHLEANGIPTVVVATARDIVESADQMAEADYAFKPAANNGTDHGWGAHHFVLGGAVRGGDLYGAFPALGAKNANNNNFDSSPDQIGNGALLPQTSVDQLGATLGRWFGLSDGQLLDVFPNLANFSQRNLGFMT